MRPLTFALVLVSAGCGVHSGNGNHPDGGQSSNGLMSIDVAPANAVLTTTAAAPATQNFTATAHYGDGHSEDVTAKVTWALSDQGLGLITAGQFTGTPLRGGLSNVAVLYDSVGASVPLTVKYVDSRVSTDDNSTAPATSASQFGVPQNAAQAPTLAYPLDGARVPHNLNRLEVQWTPPTGVDLFEVAFESATTEYKVYTNALVPHGGRVALTPTEWKSIADSNQGQTVSVQVSAVSSSAPGSEGTSTVAKLFVDADDVQGGLYYWSPVGAGQTGDVIRTAFGDVTNVSTPYYSPSGGGRCVGCHVLTRDGTRFAITYDGGNGPAADLNVADQSNVLPESMGRAWNFAAFSPDGNRLVATSKGTLSIIDTSGGPANGTVLQVLEDGSSGHYASHPDWSPDGSAIVYVNVGSPNGNSEWTFQKGSIVVATDMGAGVFGAAQMLWQSKGENNYYPSFSPDGKWILFNRGDNSAYNDPTAELYVISADGKVGPIALSNASSGKPNLTNSWPRWSPFVQLEPDGTNLLYFTFSSTRDYGVELVGVSQPQIWMAAFDPQKAAAGLDASSVSFWMPYQDVKSHNHIAQWTTTIVPIN